MSRCQVCGQVMIDDVEVGQGYHITPPCWMYATSRFLLAQKWEAENPGFWMQADVREGLAHLCEHCGCELENPDEPCPWCYIEDAECDSIL